ncbi:MAG TPA: hypothetical protein VMI31_16785 [Fimbriimonadaceae bacterium]|nr:hypothetical protein [Fimbriimonadaceae bacterium]
MDDLTALRLELAELKREVTVLKRTRWITPGSIALALASLVALGVAAPRRQATAQGGQEHVPVQIAQDISCKSLTVTDANGKPMIQLGTEATGGIMTLNGVAGATMVKINSDSSGGALLINASDGNKRILEAVANNSGYTDWCDPAGNRRATVFVGDEGAEFHLAGKGNQPETILQQNESGGAFILDGADGFNRIHEGIDNGGGFFDLSDKLGNVRESFYLSDKDTAQFRLIGADKAIRLLASGEPKQGELTSYDENTKAVAVFPSKK